MDSTTLNSDPSLTMSSQRLSSYNLRQDHFGVGVGAGVGVGVGDGDWETAVHASKHRDAEKTKFYGRRGIKVVSLFFVSFFFLISHT